MNRDGVSVRVAYDRKVAGRCFERTEDTASPSVSASHGGRKRSVPRFADFKTVQTETVRLHHLSERQKFVEVASEKYGLEDKIRGDVMHVSSWVKTIPEDVIIRVRHEERTGRRND